ncbi:hypothetical protein Scep_029656 [Stephania cephalantha]|uniref:Uncharacterized protein n=1 Tax=Stephania cephalantha TaxID=152367 RepID=A0AAP0DY37_9MAGN
MAARLRAEPKRGPTAATRLQQHLRRVDSRSGADEAAQAAARQSEARDGARRQETAAAMWHAAPASESSSGAVNDVERRCGGALPERSIPDKTQR